MYELHFIASGFSCAPLQPGCKRHHLWQQSLMACSLLFVLVLVLVLAATWVPVPQFASS